jgi:hypothetical protein
MMGIQKTAGGDIRRDPLALESWKRKINDQTYLYDAINCLAMVLSNEILHIHQGGIAHEWERRSPTQRVSPSRADGYRA